MNWLFFALLSVFAGSVSNLYQKIAMREEKSDAVASAAAFQILTGLAYFVYALVRGFHFPDVSLAPYFLISMILYAAGTVFFFRAIKLIEASEMTILNGVGSLVTILASFIFLHESLSLMQIVGALLILLAVIVINFSKKGIVINKGMWFAVAGTCSYGLAVISDTHIIRSFEAASFIPIGALGTALVLMLWYYKKIPLVIKTVKSAEKNLVIFCMLYAISAIAFYHALQLGALVGQVSTIFRASIIVTVILSSIFLNERKHLVKKILGAILTTIGVILVSI